MKELALTVLTLPLRAPAPKGNPSAGLSREAGDAAQVVERGWTQLSARAGEGDPAAANILALAPEISLDACRRALDEIGAEAAADDVSARIYAAALREFAAERLHPCIGLLAALMFEAEPGADPLIGLAICAMRLERFAEADMLAAESIRKGSKHPRVFCVAAVCRLQAGGKSEAMDLLALASRLARRDPEFRDDLRIAQRLLISLHYG